MRKLTGHIVNPTNDRLVVTVQDDPGAGGANHLYVVEGFDLSTNPSNTIVTGTHSTKRLTIVFQNGPIAEFGVNGVTQEVLLEIVADRLRSFQAGPYACQENAVALGRVEDAMRELQSRTRARMARGVEGTSQK